MSLVTHLECSLTGERHEAGQVHNLSRAGKPLLVRYDLDEAGRTLTHESVAQREPGMWKWRELLPNDREPVSLGEIETPIIPLTRTGGPNLLVKDEGRLPTGSFKARGLSLADDGKCRSAIVPAMRLGSVRPRRHGAGPPAVGVTVDETRSGSEGREVLCYTAPTHRGAEFPST